MRKIPCYLSDTQRFATRDQFKNACSHRQAVSGEPPVRAPRFKTWAVCGGRSDPGRLYGGANAFFSIQSTVILPAMIFTAGILKPDGLELRAR